MEKQSVTTTAEVRVSARGAARIRALHPWVFRDDVVTASGLPNGAIVRVLTTPGKPIGFAFLSSRSKIALRVLATTDGLPDRDHWSARVAEARAFRERVVRDTDAHRVLFAESDDVPGLVVDRYGAHLVVQALTAGAAQVLDMVLDALAEAAPFESVLARNDSAVRELEGLPREVTQLRGRTPPEIEVREGAVVYVVDPWTGQKTGAFLDQRENRIGAAAYARGRVLDAFSYHGSFGLHAAAAADSVEMVDSSQPALARARTNAERNGFRNVTTREANVFDDLRERARRGERFDTIYLDPPAFAKSRADLPAARRGYKEINLRALQLLAPGGMLVTSSCSYNLSEGDWTALVEAAAADAQRVVRVVERRSQARDHPVRLGFPESRYLKCLILAAP
jgi:23S rRNA (cytosine1962-C5)-methyltransferase